VVNVVSHHSQLVVDSETNWQPVELAQQQVCVAQLECFQCWDEGIYLGVLGLNIK